MSEFYNLMGIGFADSQDQMGCDVIIGLATIRGVLNPAPVMLTQADSGEQIEIDQSVDVFEADLTAAGVTDLVALAGGKTRANVDGKPCRITGYSSDGADPTVTLHLKYGH